MRQPITCQRCGDFFKPADPHFAADACAGISGLCHGCLEPLVAVLWPVPTDPYPVDFSRLVFWLLTRLLSIKAVVGLLRLAIAVAGVALACAAPIFLIPGRLIIPAAGAYVTALCMAIAVPVACYIATQGLLFLYPHAAQLVLALETLDSRLVRATPKPWTRLILTFFLVRAVLVGLAVRQLLLFTEFTTSDPIVNAATQVIPVLISCWWVWPTLGVLIPAFALEDDLSLTRGRHYLDSAKDGHRWPVLLFVMISIIAMRLLGLVSLPLAVIIGLLLTVAFVVFHSAVFLAFGWSERYSRINAMRSLNEQRRYLRELGELTDFSA